jgi:hypothetical protein
MERTRVWRGTVKPEARDEHERFVAWLGTDEAAAQYAKYLLTGYTLAQQGDDLTITMGAEEPVALIRFLRNPRMWPEFWEFRSAAAGTDAPTAEGVRVRWRREAEAP